MTRKRATPSTPYNARKRAFVYTDNRGHPLEIGTRVAFNYSGYIAIGTIEKITSGFHIRRETHIAGYHSKNTLSQVRSVNSIMAINEVVIEDLTAEVEEKLERRLRLLFYQIDEAWDLDEIKMYLDREMPGWQEKVLIEEELDGVPE